MGRVICWCRFGLLPVNDSLDFSFSVTPILLFTDSLGPSGEKFPLALEMHLMTKFLATIEK